MKPDWDTRLFTPASAAELDKFDALLMPHPPRLPGFVAADILRTSREHAWIIRRAMDSMLTGHDTTDALIPNLKMPVLIVWGEVDQITPLSRRRENPSTHSAIAVGCHCRMRPPGSERVRQPDRPENGGVCEAVADLSVEKNTVRGARMLSRNRRPARRRPQSCPSLITRRSLRRVPSPRLSALLQRRILFGVSLISMIFSSPAAPSLQGTPM